MPPASAAKIRPLPRTTPPTGAALKEHFRDKVVVIAGVEGEMGLALAGQLLAAHATVFAGLHGARPSAALTALGQRHAQTLHVLQLDVADPVSVRLFARQVGALRVDVLINNAAINVDERARIIDLPEDRIQATFNVNTTGPVRLTQAFYDLLRRSERPVVANISSLLGSFTEATATGSAAYRMSKAALNMFGLTLAQEQPDLIVLSLHPGFTRGRHPNDARAIDAHAAASGILRLIATATPTQSGQFYRYTGEPAPW